MCRVECKKKKADHHQVRCDHSQRVILFEIKFSCSFRERFFTSVKKKRRKETKVFTKNNHVLTKLLIRSTSF